jgi:hypothetical protein
VAERCSLHAADFCALSAALGAGPPPDGLDGVTVVFPPRDSAPWTRGHREPGQLTYDWVPGHVLFPPWGRAQDRASRAQVVFAFLLPAPMALLDALLWAAVVSRGVRLITFQSHPSGEDPAAGAAVRAGPRPWLPLECGRGLLGLLRLYQHIDPPPPNIPSDEEQEPEPEPEPEPEMSSVEPMSRPESDVIAHWQPAAPQSHVIGVPVGHTEFSWRSSGASIVPANHTAFSWGAGLLEPAAEGLCSPTAAATIVVGQPHQADPMAALVAGRDRSRAPQASVPA